MKVAIESRRLGSAFMAFGDCGGGITIRVGNETSLSELASDWMLTHKMVHLAFPSVDDKHHWIEEGIATYVEPIARIRAGHLEVEQMWLILFGTCLKVSLSLGTAGWITRTPGEERIGEERSFAF